MSLHKSKFIPESKIVPNLIKETKFLNDPSISNNAKKIIDASIIFFALFEIDGSFKNFVSLIRFGTIFDSGINLLLCSDI